MYDPLNDNGSYIQYSNNIQNVFGLNTHLYMIEMLDYEDYSQPNNVFKCDLSTKTVHQIASMNIYRSNPGKF